MENLRELMTTDWSLKSAEDVLTAFQTTPEGLSGAEAAGRRKDLGPNEIAQGKPTPWYVLLWRQFANPLVYILLLAAIVTGAMGHVNDVIIIAAVLVFNAAIGYYQERKAERAINNIKGMTAPQCKVKRGGELVSLPAVELVPGDVMVLDEGDRICADARLLLAVRLRVEEAIFTGESIAAEKGAGIIEKAAVLADKANMVFMGTYVTAGRGEAVVTGTGMKTELGKIAGLVQSAEEVLTPLQKRLEDFTAFIVKAVLGICVIIFFFSFGIYRFPFGEVLLNTIAMAVSAIPEGLPVVITLVLALGVRRMANHQALIRRLPTAETLGSATVICTDKTGTLTRNEMVVTHVFVAEQELTVTGEGYSCDGAVQGPVKEPATAEAVGRLIETGVLCNNSLVRQGADQQWEMVGDGTEGALMTLAGKWHRDLLSLRTRKRRVGEVPFDSRTKFMVTVVAEETGASAHMKGSLEAVMHRCSHVQTASGVRLLTAGERDALEAVNLRYADEALRVLALARKPLSPEINIDRYVEEEQNGYTLLGLVGMMDLPRPEAVAAVAKCRQAGIRVVMITGDHAATARAVGKKVGLFDEGMKLLTGADLTSIDDVELSRMVETVAIYARTSPEDKMRIIQALQAHDHVVAMTGDGVNDAPALTRADIGVAMGQSGTDVAKEAAGMVLMNDNFASIVAAVEEGRVIYNNLRKAIGFLVSTNSGEVLTLLTASVLGFAAPLRAVQILWINLVTDGFTTIALGVDPADGDEMTAPPRSPKEPLLSKNMGETVALVASLMCVGTLLAYYIGSSLGTVERGQTMAFGTMVFFQLFNIYNCRNFEKSLFQVGIFNNLPLFCAVTFSAILQLMAMYVPFLKNLMGAVTLTAFELGITIGIAFTVIPLVEILKFLNRPVTLTDGDS
jgi:Ca2+-transporting ATPase